MIILEANQTGTGILIENVGFIGDVNQPILKESGHSDKYNNLNTGEYVTILQKYDIKNANNRIYPEKVLRREANKYKNKIALKESLGELNHPTNLELNGDRISHYITDLWFEGNTMVGKVQLILSEAFKNGNGVFTKGDLVQTYINEGVRVGVSSRGAGSVENRGGINYVCEDMSVLCWDIVLNPSTPNAWMFTKPNSHTQFVESNQKINDKLDKFLLG